LAPLLWSQQTKNTGAEVAPSRTNLSLNALQLPLGTLYGTAVGPLRLLERVKLLTLAPGSVLQTMNLPSCRFAQLLHSLVLSW
jgi:hypothetical protein